MKNEITPEDIVKKVINGDVNSYKIIIDLFQKQVFNIGMRMLKNDEDAYDFTQEVFIKAYERLLSYKGSAPFKYWLTKIAYNYGVDKIKQKKVEQDIDSVEISSHDDYPEANHLKSEIQQLLEEEVGKLPDEYKLCLDFYFYFGLSYKQIENITEIPINTIKSHVLRAKNILRNKLRGTIAEDYHEL